MKIEEENKSLDRLINKSMNDSHLAKLSDSFTDNLMRKIQQKLAWKEIISEFLGKAFLVLALLVFAAGVLFIPAFANFLKLITGFTSYWQLILYPAIILIFTLTFDQLILKYLFSRN